MNRAINNLDELIKTASSGLTGAHSSSSAEEVTNLLHTLIELPVAKIVPAMGLRFESVIATKSPDVLRRFESICRNCEIQQACIRNLKACMRDPDLIDQCPLWDAGLLD